MTAVFGFLGRGAGKQTPKQQTGRAGERAAEKFLRKQGYRIIARNVTCRAGEVDLVATEGRGGTICFVEVRSRSLTDGAEPAISPEASVTPAKRRRIIRAARRFLADHRTAGRAVRFDVIAVRFAAERGLKQPDVRHYAGAFDVTGRPT